VHQVGDQTKDKFASPICQPTPTIMNLSTRVTKSVPTLERDSNSCLSGHRPGCTYGQ